MTPAKTATMCSKENPIKNTKAMEAIAMEKAITFTKSIRVKDIVVEGDSMEMVRVLLLEKYC
jgi:hypothetical protein